MKSRDIATIPTYNPFEVLTPSSRKPRNKKRHKGAAVEATPVKADTSKLSTKGTTKSIVAQLADAAESIAPAAIATATVVMNAAPAAADHDNGCDPFHLEGTCAPIVVHNMKTNSSEPEEAALAVYESFFKITHPMSGEVFMPDAVRNALWTRLDDCVEKYAKWSDAVGLQYNTRCADGGVVALGSSPYYAVQVIWNNASCIASGFTAFIIAPKLTHCIMHATQDTAKIAWDTAQSLAKECAEKCKPQPESGFGVGTVVAVGTAAVVTGAGLFALYKRWRRDGYHSLGSDDVSLNPSGSGRYSPTS